MVRPELDREIVVVAHQRSVSLPLPRCELRVTPDVRSRPASEGASSVFVSVRSGGVRAPPRVNLIERRRIGYVSSAATRAGGGVAQRRVVVVLPASPRAASTARRAVASTLRSWRLEVLSPDAELVVSELVTNAVIHAPGSASHQLQIFRRDVGVRLVVSDGSVSPPAVRVPGDGMPGRTRSSHRRDPRIRLGLRPLLRRQGCLGRSRPAELHPTDLNIAGRIGAGIAPAADGDTGAGTIAVVGPSTGGRRLPGCVRPSTGGCRAGTVVVWLRRGRRVAWRS